MSIEIQNVEVRPGDQPMLIITMSDGETSTIPLHPPVMALLNAGGWLMREYVARSFEADLGGPNLVSRRVRLLNAGERATDAPSPASAAAQ